MPKPHRARQPGEKERFEVLLEEVRTSLRQLAEGHIHLDQRMQAGFNELRQEMNQRFAVVEQALRENSQAIQKNSADIQKNSADIQKNSADIRELQVALVDLRQEVRQVGSWAKSHEAAHTTR